MSAIKGYYSLVQFCPDPARLESVNLGVVLFCPEASFINARMSRNNQRAAKLVGNTGFDRAYLNAAKRAFEKRFSVDREAFKTLDDFHRFVNSRANILKLTQPRPVKVFDPEQDLDQLFGELVGGRLRTTKVANQAEPKLDELFQKLHRQGRAKLDWKVPVPLTGRSLHAKYAYKNGVWNLVIPQLFSNHEGPAINTALRLGAEADLIAKKSPESEKKKLIIVSSFEHDGEVGELEQRVNNVLNEYQVRNVAESEVDAFVTEVENTAH